MEKQEEKNNNVSGDTKNDKPKKPQRGGAQPGKFKIKTKIEMESTAGQFGTMVFDNRAPQNIAARLSRKVYPVETTLNHFAMDELDFDRLVYRMICALFAKKLATAMSPNQLMEFGGNVKHISSLPLHGPSGLVPLIDHFGCTEHDGVTFELLGQPILAFSLFCRATVNGAVLDRHEHLFVNTRWVGARDQLREYLVSVVRSWAENMPPQNFDFAGNAITMSVPRPTQGFAVYRALVEQVAKPAVVLRAIMAVEMLERIGGAAFTQQDVADFNQLRISFVELNSQGITNAGLDYVRTVEDPLRNAMSRATNWVKIHEFKTYGSEAQLLTRSSMHAVDCPFRLTGEALDLGWMFASEMGYVTINNRSYHGDHSETVQNGLNDYIEGMLRAKS